MEQISFPLEFGNDRKLNIDLVLDFKQSSEALKSRSEGMCLETLFSCAAAQGAQALLSLSPSLSRPIPVPVLSLPALLPSHAQLLASSRPGTFPPFCFSKGGMQGGPGAASTQLWISSSEVQVQYQESRTLLSAVGWAQGEVAGAGSEILSEILALCRSCCSLGPVWGCTGVTGAAQPWFLLSWAVLWVLKAALWSPSCGKQIWSTEGAQSRGHNDLLVTKHWVFFHQNDSLKSCASTTRTNAKI